jgi:serine/threonine-protein kinase HipA
MTLTQHADGEAGASYLEFVDLLQSRGANTRADCEQLFRRVLFNILIHNTDDHLCNHGFFIDEGGIRLSPAYDMNPSLDRQELTLAINEVETACDVSIAIDACRYYGLNPQQAGQVLEQVQGAVDGWRDEASRLNIPKAELDLMAGAFQTT